jgi:uncharacterized membrane protein YgcG
VKKFRTTKNLKLKNENPPGHVYLDMFHDTYAKKNLPAKLPQDMCTWMMKDNAAERMTLDQGIAALSHVKTLPDPADAEGKPKIMTKELLATMAQGMEKDAVSSGSTGSGSTGSGSTGSGSAGSNGGGGGQ